MKNNEINAAIAAMTSAKTYRQKQSALKMARSAGMAVNVLLNAQNATLTTEIDRLVTGYGAIVKTNSKRAKIDRAIGQTRSQHAGIIAENTEMPHVWDDTRPIAEKLWQLAKAGASSTSAGITFKKECDLYTTYAGDAARAIALLKLPSTNRRGVLTASFNATQKTLICDRAKVAGITLNIV
jgi:hypothetical protein